MEKKIKILFADDDLKYSMLLKRFLEEHGYLVTYAGNELRPPSSSVLITSRQADVLRLLAKNVGKVVSKDMIQETVWGNSLLCQFTCSECSDYLSSSRLAA